jgi:deoxyribodipyrimidine photo-lyase
MIAEQRLRVLSHRPPPGRPGCVVYWMQASQRTRFNHALEHAAGEANRLGLPLLACFGLTDDYPEANARHYAFMLQGLRDVEAALRRRCVRFVVRRGEPPEVALAVAREAAAALLVCDRGYTRHQKRWRDRVADAAACPVIEVETDAVVPADAASDKQESAARTLRPKLHRLWPQYLVPLAQTRVRHPSLAMKVRGDVDVSEPAKALSTLKVDRSVLPSDHFEGGQDEAGRRLKRFLGKTLAGYAEGRNEPAAAHTSMLSAYLHFGHVSALELMLAVRDSDAPAADRDAYLEELGVRRELAINFVHHAPQYDRYEGLPRWCRQTLDQHRGDPRPYVYSFEQLESAQTHDPFWNAAQREMTATGYMHNYMRMYWGKKVLEWSASPEEAYEHLIALNNKWFLCGRSPNAWANVGWIFGLHDRPWGPRRPIFGTVRYMNAAGLRRKFDMEAYVERVSRLDGSPTRQRGG